MPNFAHDGHRHCPTCVSLVCDFDKRCIECAEWSNDKFLGFIKHRHVLELTRARKAKKKSQSKQTTLDLPVTTVASLTTSAHTISPSTSSHSIIDLLPSSSVLAYSPNAIAHFLPLPLLLLLFPNEIR